MPIIHFHGFARTAEKRRQLIEGITQITCRTYDVTPETVTVYVFDVSKDRVAHGGVLACDGGEKTIPADKPWLMSEY
jgi:4-oxalocrotonate tautomerase family enzyme